MLQPGLGSGHNMNITWHGLCQISVHNTKHWKLYMTEYLRNEAEVRHDYSLTTYRQCKKKEKQIWRREHLQYVHCSGGMSLQERSKHIYLVHLTSYKCIYSCMHLFYKQMIVHAEGTHFMEMGLYKIKSWAGNNARTSEPFVN